MVSGIGKRGTALAAACAWAFAAGGCRPEPPTLSVADVKLASIEGSGLHVVVDFRVTNPNRYDLALKRFAVEMAAGGTKLAGGSAVAPIPAFRARGTTEVSAALRIGLAEALAAGRQLGRERAIDYSLAGEAVFDCGGVELPVAIAKAGRIALVESLKWHMKKVEMPRGLGEPGAVRFAVTNPNGFAVPLAGVFGDLKVNDQTLVSVDAPSLADVPAGAMVEVTIPVRLHAEGLARLAAAGVGKAKLRFEPHVRFTRPVSLLRNRVKSE